MKYKSFANEVVEAMNAASETALEGTGLEIQRDITNKITINKQVDTGRMRASVTYVAGNKVGNVGKEAEPQDKPSGSLSQDTLHVGSNVEYAPAQEKANPFLQPIISKNIGRYTDMLSDIYTKLVK